MANKLGLRGCWALGFKGERPNGPPLSNPPVAAGFALISPVTFLLIPGRVGLAVDPPPVRSAAAEELIPLFALLSGKNPATKDRKSVV